MNRFVLALVVLALPAVIVGQPETPVAIYGIGNDRCWIWNEHTEPTERVDYVNWIAGFVSGLASAGNRTMRETSVPIMATRIDGYCAVNPNQPIWRAVEQFVREINR
jgi:hypothetical protein